MRNSKYDAGTYFIYILYCDGKNHAPLDIVNISSFTGFHTCQVISRISEPSTVSTTVIAHTKCFALVSLLVDLWARPSQDSIPKQRPTLH